MLESLENIKYYDSSSFFLIAGPCVVEGENQTFEIASQLKSICEKLEIPLIFKASYRKANRSRVDSFTGIGDAKALSILDKIRSDLNIPVITDVHTESEATLAAHSVDILQIPAFLCRQTELLIAAGKTGKIVNIKKGQFMSPGAMKFAVDKIHQSGNENVMLTERGTCFGYQDLVVDFRSIPIMKGFGCPVVLDCTHALQIPNQSKGVTGGNPSMIATLAKAGIVTGADGLFIETHPDPANAKSDGANMLPLDQMEPLIKSLIPIKRAVSQ